MVSVPGERHACPSDVLRGMAAGYHLTRALVATGGVRAQSRAGAPEGVRLTVKRAEEHLRLARGFLGACGFESGAKGWRLYA